MDKLTITNRKGQKLVILLEKPHSPKGLAFVMHGLGGTKDQSQIATFAQSFTDKGFTVVRFDTTNTHGESDGKYEDATVTNYYEDLEDVIAWAGTQIWYHEPFYLAGHSVGGLSITLYAEKYPEKVKGLAPISTLISGQLSAEVHGEAYLKEWEKTGLKIEPRESNPYEMKQLKWSHMLDRMKYSILPQANKLSMPVLLIVGDKDAVTPLNHQELFLDTLSSEKALHVVQGASHTFREAEHLEEIDQLFAQWIEKVEKMR